MPGDLVINEFLVDPALGDAGDANCSGDRDAQDDEFIEIVNVTDTLLDLSGITISDDNPVVRFTFALGTSVEAGGVIVVFGAMPSCTFPAGVQVFAAGDLSLRNTGDAITIADSTGTTIVGLTYTGTNDDDASHTLDPDLIDTNADPAIVEGFVLHTSTAVGTAFSPGTQINGTAF